MEITRKQLTRLTHVVFAYLGINQNGSIYFNSEHAKQRFSLIVDIINVRSMDYYGAWGDQWGTSTGPSAPLYSTLTARRTFSVDWTLKYYVCKTQRPELFNIAVPFYGSVWKNVEDPINSDYEIWRNVNMIDNKTDGKAYMSRKIMEQEKWKTKAANWDETTQSSYIWNPTNLTFLTFETERSIDAKTNYVNEINLGGVTIWSIDMDDDRHTLLNAVTTNGIYSRKSESIVMYKC